MSTIGSGSGEYCARCVGFSRVGDVDRLEAARVPGAERDVLRQRRVVRRERRPRRGSKTLHISGSFWISLNSERTTGLAASEMSMKRAQPHGQPWPAAVDRAVDLVGDVDPVGLFQSRTALCPPGPGHFDAVGVLGDEPVGVRGRVLSGEVRHVGDAKSPSSSAKYARLPSLETVIEWMPEPDPESKPWLPLNRIASAPGPSAPARCRRSGSRAGRCGEHQRAVRVLRVLPDEELVRVARVLVSSFGFAPLSPEMS